MPAEKRRIEESMKMENNPLVYLEYTPPQKLIEFLKSKKIFSKTIRKKPKMRSCMGYVSRPYKSTYRITTCRHLISTKSGEIPTKKEILKGLEVFARYEGVNKKLHSLMFEDVNIKVHEDMLVDLIFIEISHPDNYNFQLLNQAAVECKKRFPGNQVYYFQNHTKEHYFRFFEGQTSQDKIYITGIDHNGHFFYLEEKPNIHHRRFYTIIAEEEAILQGASGSPLLSRKGEVIGMVCAHDQNKGRVIYLSVEKIERLYNEIDSYHL